MAFYHYQLVYSYNSENIYIRPNNLSGAEIMINIVHVLAFQLNKVIVKSLKATIFDW